MDADTKIDITARLQIIQGSAQRINMQESNPADARHWARVVVNQVDEIVKLLALHNCRVKSGPPGRESSAGG